MAHNWGEPPWRIDFHPEPRALPDDVDFAIVGGGFTGLAAAAWLRRLDPGKSVALFEAGRIGAGASGRTGGIALAETAAGDLPGLGDVLEGFEKILRALEIECGLSLSGAWEIGRSGGRHDSEIPSPIRWEDSGTLRVVNEVPGGSVDPGKMVSGLGRAAQNLGAEIFENTPVREMLWGEPIELLLPERRIRARHALIATNALALELSGLAGRAEPMFTLALATEPLDERQLEIIGLGARTPFYTVDFPYLWGRALATGGMVWGAGLVRCRDWHELAAIDVQAGEAAELLARLERRVRGLHTELAPVRITHRWGGPILVADGWKPVFARHPASGKALVLGGYAGHGVALSVYLGASAAEVLLGRRELPEWTGLPHT
jgi:glycine/D-amino acid oxidase-like deaminating enzyme